MPTSAQIHVRVPVSFKRAVKVFCAREGMTEQQWVFDLLRRELARRAPDLLPDQQPGNEATVPLTGQSQQPRRS